MDFYLNVCSDGSTTSFPTNRAGNFKALLTKEIDLNNIEYSVAVSSVSRYYETSQNDVVFIREKRDVPAANLNLPLTVHNTYPATSSVDKIKQKYDDFIKNGDPIYAVSDKEKFLVEMDVNGKKKTFEIYTSPIYKSTLAKAVSYTSEEFEGVRFELGDMLGEGIITVICPSGKLLTVKFTFPETTYQKLAIVQPAFTSVLYDTKKRDIIGLRDKKWKSKFVDLRGTLPHYVQFSEEGKVGDVNYHSRIKIFEKVGGKLTDYLEPPFYGNAKSVSLVDVGILPYWKIHSTIATLFKLPEEIKQKT